MKTRRHAESFLDGILRATRRGTMVLLASAILIGPAGRLMADEREEAGILAHMNTDHGDSLLAYCRHVHGVQTQAAQMVGIDPDGFDVLTGERLLRFDFAEPITDAQGARQTLVELSRQCRA